MDSVLPTKGTGVVTSVPSDSPDDYATMADLAKKSEYYGIKKEWAELEIISVITTPSYGDKAAEFLVKKLKIMSPKDVKQLADAKELAYKEGFYSGQPYALKQLAAILILRLCRYHELWRLQR